MQVCNKVRGKGEKRDEGRIRMEDGKDYLKIVRIAHARDTMKRREIGEQMGQVEMVCFGSSVVADL